MEKAILRDADLTGTKRRVTGFRRQNETFLSMQDQSHDCCAPRGFFLARSSSWHRFAEARNAIARCAESSLQSVLAKKAKPRIRRNK